MSKQSSSERKVEAEAEETHLLDPPAEFDDPSLFVNRELSLLEFQRRVLDEARDEENPLLERIKFLSILGSNLDEFFMVRVAGLMQQVGAGVVKLPADGRTPAETLAAVRKACGELFHEAGQCLGEHLIPALRDQGIELLDHDALTARQKTNVERYFEESIFPVLTPLAFDPGRPFPHISNLSLNLAVLLEDEQGERHFARIKVPGSLPRLLPLKRSSGGVRRDGTSPRKHYFVWLEQVIAANLAVLFPGMRVLESHPFRIVRDADSVIQEMGASDLLETIEESVRRRRFGQVVRLSLNTGMPAAIKQLLIRNLEVEERDVYEVQGPLGLNRLMSLHGIDRYDLKDKPFLPALPSRLAAAQEETKDIFEAIRSRDILLHHPYDSFRPVVDFLRAAARDPAVQAIKQTLYRVGGDSPVVRALLEARENGKEVAVLVELKARFDEESNIEWARALEREGVHVIYGLLGLKTHSKIALVVRREDEGLRRYVHLATGNYNAVTAHLYTDVGMFTCDPEIGAEASNLFNYLTGYGTKAEYQKLLVAPLHLRSRIEALVRREIEHCREGREGRLVFQMNALVDKRMIQLLYEASCAGVQIDLVVRGICCLRPGVKGVSENIRVRSVVGRFLEHSRIYHFHNGGAEEVYLGSADLMPRNLDYRVEVLFPVADPELIVVIRDEILGTLREDNVKARCMLPDGTYRRATRDEASEPISSQARLLAARRAQG